MYLTMTDRPGTPLHGIRRLLAGSWADALIASPGLFEPSELARLPSGVRSIDSGQTGRQ